MSYAEVVSVLEDQTGRKIPDREEALKAWMEVSGLGEDEFEIACGEGSDTPVEVDGVERPDPLDREIPGAMVVGI